MKGVGARLVVFCFLGLVCVLGVFSQVPARVSGTVADQNGDGVAGAAVTIARGGSSTAFAETKTDLEGRYLLTGLPPGDYQVTVGAVGFAKFRRDVTLTASEQLDLTIEPGQIAAHVSVTSSYLSGTSESLEEIPGSIERITAKTLENSRVFNFSEALRKIAGVNVRDEEGFGLRPNIGIRGTNPTRSTKVLLLEDGLPLSYAPYGDNSSYYHPPVERYESIEVLKGSGQIAYGPQTIAGVINYVTPNPPATPTFNLKLEGGNQRFFNGGAGFGGTFGSFGTIVNFNHKQGIGSRENTRFKLYDLSNKSTYEINSRNSLTAKFTFFREDSNLTYSGATESEYAASPRGNVFKNDFFNGRRYGFSLQHAAVLTSKISLTTTFYSNYFSRDWWRQSSNSNERPLRINTAAQPFRDLDCRGMIDLSTTCGNQGNLRDYLTVGFESRANFNFDFGSVRNDLNIGFRVHREDQDRLRKLGDLPNARDGVLVEQNERKALAYSAFGQHRFIWKNLAVTPGLRIEKMYYDRTNFLFNNGEGATGKIDLTQVIPGVGVAYSGIRNTTFFAGVHRGFSPPRVEDVITDSGGTRELDSELSWNYEAGVRTRPIRGIEMSGAFFRNDYQNQIVAATLASGTAFTNGGSTMQQGFEFTGELNSGSILRSTHNFYFRTAYTYLPLAEFRGERLSSVTSSSTLNTYCPAARRLSSSTCSITGNRLPYTPRTLLTSSVGYSHPSGIDAFIENVYMGRQFGDDLGAASPSVNGQLGAIPSQTYWNATANYRIEKWKTTFFVTAKNILDRTFVVDRSRGILPSGPRLIQTGVTVRF